MVLVRVIEFGEVIRLGGTRVIPVDVRVMASTESDLERRLVELSFRKDLYYRLSPIVIAIPPLRERPEDIPVLVERCDTAGRAGAYHDRERTGGDFGSRAGSERELERNCADVGDWTKYAVAQDEGIGRDDGGFWIGAGRRIGVFS